VRHLARVIATTISYRHAKGLPPPVIFLENVTVSAASPDLVRDDQRLVEKLFGQPVFADGARFGSRAHRARFYWQNLMPPRILQLLVDSFERPAGLTVQQILDPDHRARLSVRTETGRDSAQFPGYYLCNRLGQELLALPTFVSYHGSNAYRSLDRNGLLVRSDGGYEEPRADERERAMGMQTGATAAPGVSEDERREALGRTLDLNAVTALFALASSWQAAADEHLLAAIQADPDWAELELALEEPDVQGLLNSLSGLVAPLAAATPERPLPSVPDCIPDGFKIDINPDLPPHSKEAFMDLLRRNLNALAFSPEHCYTKHYTGGTFRVGLDKTKNPHVFSKARRLPDAHARELERVVAELAAFGVVILAPDECNYASAIVVAPKKDAEGNYTKWRVCVDYRPLNLLCSNFRYQMPLPEDIFASQTERRQNMFSTGDIMWGFHAILMDPEDAELTAFWGPAGKLYMYTRGPFGLKNLPAYFQSVMDRVFGDLAPFFIDDFLRGDEIPATPTAPWGSDCSIHIESLERIFQRAIAHGFTFAAAKLHLGYASISHLGHRVVHDLVTKTTVVTPQMSKVEAITSLAPPTNKSELQTFLGMAGYYRKYLPQFSQKAAPLRNLLAKNVQWAWGPQQRLAFDAIKADLVSPAVLRMPVKGLPYRLATDWSEHGCGAVLSQIYPDSDEYPVAFASRSCNKHERNYASYKGEMLAAVWGVEHFRMYLLGQVFTLVTDHQPLSFLMKSQRLSGLYARWACRLQEYDITVIYRPGASNSNADGISRFPLPSTVDDWERFREEIDYFSSQAAVKEASAPLPYIALAPPPTVASALCAAVLSASPTQTGSDDPVLADTTPGLVELAEIELPQLQRLPRQAEIYEDVVALHFLQNGSFPADTTAQERHRVLQKVSDYSLHPTDSLVHPFVLRRRTASPSGSISNLLVPWPSDRAALVWEAHDLGHTGLERTYDLLRSTYWWHGMKDNVKRLICTCPSCLTNNAVFSRRNPTLNPLPILGIGYSLHVDLGGYLTESYGNTYFLVVIDRTSKYMEVEPIPDKQAKTVVRAFERCWLYRWGCPAEVVHDNGREFEGEFSDILKEMGIDVRYTSANTPQSNGLAERSVRTVKSGLMKLISALPDRDRAEWARLMPRLVMSYNASVQSSLRMSPYFFITGRYPVLPFALEHVFREPLILDPEDDERTAQALLVRADALRRHGVIALGNLKIAQHRQTMYYQMDRSGQWNRPSKMFRPGDAAIMHVHGRPNLDAHTTSDPLRVLGVRSNNILILQGVDGAIIKDNMKHWAPLHHCSAIPLIDISLVRARLARRLDDALLTCWYCDDATSDMDDPVDRTDPHKNYTMILCSLCANAFHLSCLGLSSNPPEDDWRCPSCMCYWMNPVGETYFGSDLTG
jgi:hypothetical protein